jgi:hypothetical protein
MNYPTHWKLTGVNVMKAECMVISKKITATVISCVWLATSIVSATPAIASGPGSKDPEFTNKAVETKIWSLLDESNKTFVSLNTPDFMALGQGFDIPDGGKSITDLATSAPGGAFDPRDLEKIPAEKLGFKAQWVVERYKHYNMDWDITGLKLTSLNPEARKYPWFIIINGGAANWYEFFVDLKNKPGWAPYLAQKINVMIVTIPGSFKYGGWNMPIMDLKRQPQYLLDQELPTPEIYLRNVLINNQVVMQGLKQILMKDTTGDILISGHSTSGELSMLAYQDSDLAARLKGRYFGWGSGGPARLALTRPLLQPRSIRSDGGNEGSRSGKKRPLEMLSRRDVPTYSRGYTWFLNPMYEPGMSINDVAAAWLETEARRRPQFKQQIQDIEHGQGYDDRGYVEVEIRRLLKESGNPWNVNYEDVEKELMSTYFTRMDGFKKMVWTVGHMDRNHWLPEDPMNAPEVFVANQFRVSNPNIPVRLIVWDPALTHYGHLELPKQKAAADYSVIRWLMN